MPKKHIIVIHVEGGVADYTESPDIEVLFFDWDNLEQEEDMETLDDSIEDAKLIHDKESRKETLDRLMDLKAELRKMNKEG